MNPGANAVPKLPLVLLTAADSQVKYTQVCTSKSCQQYSQIETMMARKGCWIPVLEFLGLLPIFHISVKTVWWEKKKRNRPIAPACSPNKLIINNK